MPVIYDKEWGGNRVLLNPNLTIEEAVIVLLGKSLEDYPFIIFDENENHVDTYSLEDYLQGFYDADETQLVDEAIKLHELLLDAIEAGELKLHSAGLRATKLAIWAKKRGIKLSDDYIKKISIAKTQKLIGRHKQQEAAILEKIKELGYDPLKLPKNSTGNAGMRKLIRDQLEGNELFTGSTVFDGAWERLAHSKKTQYSQ